MGEVFQTMPDPVCYIEVEGFVDGTERDDSAVDLAMHLVYALNKGYFHDLDGRDVKALKMQNPEMEEENGFETLPADGNALGNSCLPPGFSKQEKETRYRQPEV